MAGSDLRALLPEDPARADWLVAWAEYLLADWRASDAPPVSASERKRRTLRVDTACGELLAALDDCRHSAVRDSILQELVENAAGSDTMAFDWGEPLSLAEMVVMLHRLQQAARQVADIRPQSGRQLDDRMAVACDVFRLALLACGFKDARSADSKMGRAFEVFLDAGDCERSDMRSLLQALANWRRSHPSDTDLYLGSLP